MNILKSLWNMRIPTLIAFIIIISAIFVISSLVKRGAINIGFLSQGAIPGNIQTANITDTSFTVSFTTKEKSAAFINFGDTENLGNTAYDTRDISQGKQSYYSHFIKVQNLSPDKKYYFSIVSNGNTYLDDNKRYSVTTGPKLLVSPLEQDSIRGKVVSADGAPADDTLIYIQIQGAQTLSVITSDLGDYIIPLDNLHGPKLARYIAVSNATPINLQIIKQGQISNVKTLYKKGLLIPPVTLARDYDFTKSNTAEENVGTASSNLKVVAPPAVKGEIRIAFPKNNDSLIDLQPTFNGTALPGKTVKIIINSQTIQTEVTADKNGYWSYRPSSALSSGQHTITIETIDASGITKRITQIFNIFPQGSQVTQSATQPANIVLAIEPTSTPTPTPRPTKIPTSTPTRVPTATTIPTATPTTVPTRTQIQLPTATPTPIKIALATTSTPTPTIRVTLPPTATPTTTKTLTPTKTTTNLLNNPNVNNINNTTPTPAIAEPGNPLSIILTSTSVFFILLGITLLFFI